AAGLGFTWLATVPPTAGLVGKLFGPRYLGTLFGLTLLSHQVGGFFGAWLGGVALEGTGSYQWMWYADMALALVAAVANAPIRERKLVPAAARVPRRRMPGSAGAARAQAVDFQGLRLRLEAERLGPRVELGHHLAVLQLHRAVAAVADQERHRVLGTVGMVAGDEGVDRGQLVHEAVGHQEIQRAVHGWRRIGAGALGLAHLLQQVVGLHRLAGIGDQPQHVGADRRQAQATLAAGPLHRPHE